ncbi:heme utilization protein HutZ [Thaumasiovibrio subtropicus]|uniref:heme utilization protein HutZ n=1 Tax=Thaumasiovibrio subtropicus TaxID=1891207 RepID=UPI000B35F6DF|nr:heme utilization protein HutZ [Thaumasiovibrio subtropicus]
MTDKAERLQGRLLPEMKELRENSQTLQLATINKEGKPTVSYTPFAYTDDAFYILISDIAAHGQNLKLNNDLSLMLIEDESAAKHIYARRRLSFETSATLIERDTATWSEGTEALKARFGEIIGNLTNMEDFRLYQIKPENGLYVKGFGQAFNVQGFDSVEVVHLDQGHVERQKQSA